MSPTICKFCNWKPCEITSFIRKCENVIQIQIADPYVSRNFAIRAENIVLQVLKFWKISIRP